MKIGFAFDALNILEVPDGKHRFLIRLAKQMRKEGIKIDNKNPPRDSLHYTLFGLIKQIHPVHDLTKQSV